MGDFSQYNMSRPALAPAMEPTPEVLNFWDLQELLVEAFCANQVYWMRVLNQEIDVDGAPTNEPGKLSDAFEAFALKESYDEEKKDLGRKGCCKGRRNGVLQNACEKFLEKNELDEKLVVKMLAVIKERLSTEPESTELKVEDLPTYRGVLALFKGLEDMSQ